MPLSSNKHRQPGQRIAPTVIDKRAAVRLRLAHLLGQLLTGDEAILIRDDLSLARDWDSDDGEEG